MYASKKGRSSTEDWLLKNCPKQSDKVLDNDVFMRNVNQYLDIDDLKSFRSVCRKWKSMSEGGFRKRTRISFNFGANVTLHNGEVVANHNENFERAKELFLKSVFENGVSFEEVCLVNIADLEDIIQFGKKLDKKEGFVKNLKICDFFPYDVRSNLPKFNVLSIVEHCLSRLECKNCTVPLNQLSYSIEDIKLDNCVITGLEGCNIAPRSFELYCVQFYEGKTMLNVIVNNLIDFRNLEKLKLNCVLGLKNILLDVRGNYKVAEVELSNIVILYSELCEWEVDSLVLEATDFPFDIHSTIKGLEVSQKAVDIPQLPQTLERLILGQSSFRYLVDTEEIRLPNLKYLFINIIVDLIYLSQSYSACQNLQSIEINWHLYGNLEFDLDKLPKSIKTVKIRFTSNRALQVTGDMNDKLEKLILFPSYHLPDQAIFWRNVQLLVNKFPAKHIVIKFDSLKSQTVLNLLKMPFETITVGILKWNTGYRAYDFFEKSGMTQLVDKKSKYYHFEKKQGRSISRNRFDEICESRV